MVTSKMESFATIVNGYKPLTIVAKLSILNVFGSPGYASDISLDWINVNMKKVYLSSF